MPQDKILGAPAFLVIQPLNSPLGHKTRETNSRKSSLAGNSGGVVMVTHGHHAVHPILATIFVLWLVRQYGWRKKE